jgi:hypothetical protein
VTQCLAGVVEACVVPVVAAARSDEDLAPMVAVADSLREGLKLRYQNFFPEVLGVIAAMFTALGPHSATVMADTLRSLVQVCVCVCVCVCVRSFA